MILLVTSHDLPPPPPTPFPFLLSDGAMDDKSVVKAKGLWEDWHMRQLSEQASRINHRSGAAETGPLLSALSFTVLCVGRNHVDLLSSGICFWLYGERSEKSEQHIKLHIFPELLLRVGSTIQAGLLRAAITSLSCERRHC